MNGFQRFALVILCILAVMICYPYYPTGATWGFAGIILAVWTGVIMVLSVLLGVLGLDRFEWVNRLVTLLLMVGILYSLLNYMPQEDNKTPLVKLQQGLRPSGEDIKTGIKRLTFNFDFVHRNVRSDRNFVNQNEKKNETESLKKKQENNWTNVDIQVDE
jgi:hypothetical protein